MSLMYEIHAKGLCPSGIIRIFAERRKTKSFRMEDNNKTREVELDEIKEVCNEQTSSMIDETVSDMLKFVQRYDSKED